jgi:uncharacterized membrane protein YbaN (DUF454 family)
MKLKKWLRVVFGCIALIIGTVGLITPFLPGWVFLAVGMLLLSHAVPLFERWVARLEQRVPACRPHLHKVRQWLD